ncbi:MAG: hypothetical protein WCI54_12840 [Bacteroidia bacterium]
MNPYYYLFYKLNHFLNRKGDNEWGVIYGITILFGLNIVYVYIKLLHITQENYQGFYEIIIGIVSVSLFATNAILFQNNNRVIKITNRYKGESKSSSKIVSFLVIL